MKAWRRSGGLGPGAGDVVTIVNVITFGTDTVQVTFSRVVTAWSQPDRLNVNSTDMDNVVGGLGTAVILVDGGDIFDVGQAWIFTAAGAGIVFAPAGTIANQSGVTL